MEQNGAIESVTALAVTPFRRRAIPTRLHRGPRLLRRMCPQAADRTLPGTALRQVNGTTKEQSVHTTLWHVSQCAYYVAQSRELALNQSTGPQILAVLAAKEFLSNEKALPGVFPSEVAHAGKG
jgi:hypothetical protein